MKMYSDLSPYQIWTKLLSVAAIHFLSGVFPLSAQQDSIAYSVSSDSVYITATRIRQIVTEAPYAVSILQPDFIIKGQQRLSLKEALDYIPGVFIMNAENYAQDLRISVRGYGARSAFGIRGIKFLVDGVPESTPDGQGQVDNLDMNVVEQIEVLRGPSSGLYGNASGGLISVSTDKKFDQNFTEIFVAGGSFNFKNLNIRSGHRMGKLSALLQASHVRTDGFRILGNMQNTILNGRLTYVFNEKDKITLLLNHSNSPVADDPGGLTAAEVEQNRGNAAPLNIRFRAGERVTQSKYAMSWNRVGKNHSLDATVWYIYRDFENALPFMNGGIVVLKRHFPGMSLKYNHRTTISNIPWSVTLGIDVESQEDLRLRFNNTEGIKTGNEVFRQKEIFRNTGIYMINKLDIMRNLEFSLSVRQDIMAIQSRPADMPGDAILYNYLNPAAGMLYKAGRQWHIYANYTSNIESPALIELSNNPTGTTGFNTMLKPQISYGKEIGLRWQPNKRLKAELAFFQINIKDEILPYELIDFPQRIFYRNAGITLRKGAESSIHYKISDNIQFYSAYTYSDFRYNSYISGGTDFSGKRPAAIPEHQWFSDLRYSSADGWYLILNKRYVSPLFANDANTISDRGYLLLSIRGGFLFRIGGQKAEPTFGVNNLTDIRYNSNIRINAAGGRYYEPAPGRNFYISVKVNIAYKTSGRLSGKE